MQTDNHVKPDAEPASVAPVRVQRSVGLPSMTPLVTNGRCYHEWIKQPDGSYTCWKCGEEKPAGSVEDRQPNEKVSHGGDSEQ